MSEDQYLDSQYRLGLCGEQKLKKHSIYRFEKMEEDTGFRVFRKNDMVEVVLRNGIVRVFAGKNSTQDDFFVAFKDRHYKGDPERKLIAERCLVDSRRLLWDITGTLLREEYNRGNKNVPRWAVVKASKCIARRVYHYLDELMCEEDKIVLALQRKIYALSGRVEQYTPQIILTLVSQGESALLRDALQYRAAAALVAMANDSSSFKKWLGETSDWKSAYSYKKQSYSALNKTLMNLPGRVPVRLLGMLKRVKLERPIKDRIELIFLLAYENAAKTDTRGPANRHLVMHAKRKDILAALEIFNAPRKAWLEEHSQELNWRQLKTQGRLSRGAIAVNICEMAEYLADYPYKFNGRILGLLKAAKQWHTLEEQEKLRTTFEATGYERELPRLRTETGSLGAPGVRRLQTVKELWEEGEKMHHCIRSYLEQCLYGFVEIYHINHNGEEATGALHTNGEITVHGPMNNENGACVYGRKTFEGISKEFQNEREEAVF